MEDFKYYLEKSQELGKVEKIFQILVYVSGLPNVRPSEVVVFESGQTGHVLSIGKKFVEILLLSNESVDVDCRVTRTGKEVSIPVGDHLLGKTTDSLGGGNLADGEELRFIHSPILGINARKVINKPFITGVSIVDLIVSLGKGQRELVIGDRKSGKTPFLLQCALSSVRQGMVCVYAGIAKKASDIYMIETYFKENNISENTVLVASNSSDPASLVFLTPYSAMTIAEYFRDKGKDVLVILDDMTAHAKYYREITLLAKRFPGRSSYPGDIFYIHSRLMERAGNFVFTSKEKGKITRREASITCFPVAELVAGDLSGYIQTNLMSMTDGHIYFDINLFNEGRRPSVNPFLSVTRVGRQAQTPLVRELSGVLTSFLVRIRDLEQFLHFGTELTEKSKKDLSLGNQIKDFFQQSSNVVVPINVGIFLFALLWSGILKDKEQSELISFIATVINNYTTNLDYQKTIDALVNSSNTLDMLIQEVRAKSNSLTA